MMRPDPKTSGERRRGQHLRARTGLTRGAPFWLSAALLALALLIQHLAPEFHHRISHLTFDQMQRLHPRPYPAQLPLRVVAIDEASLARHGQWPWPRDRLAEIVNRLTKLGARVVVLDLLLAEPDRTSPGRLAERWAERPELAEQLGRLPEPDQRLTEAIAAGRVVTGFLVHDHEGASTAPEQRARFPTFGGDARPALHRFGAATPTLPTLQGAAAGNGVISQYTEAFDGVIRRMGLLFRLRDQLHPSLGLEALRLYLGQRNLPLHLRNGALSHLKLGPLTLPLTDDGEAWLHYRPFNPDRYLSATTLLDGEVAPERIADHLVFVGVTAKALVENQHTHTPLGEVVPGVEAHLQLVEQILTGDTLRPAPWGGALTTLLLFAAWITLLWLMERAHPSWSLALTATLVIALLALAWGVFLHQRLLYDPLYPSLTLLALLFAMIVPQLLQSARERRLIRARNAFMANMSHEIRTPMNAIIGLTFLALRSDSPRRVGGYLEQIHSASHSLLRIIDDILDFSKMDAGKLTIERIPFRLDEVLEQLTSVVAVKAEEKGLELIFQLDPALPPKLLGDPLRLGQILINLTNNAVKFTERGEIVVTVTPKASGAEGNPWVEFTVRDSGIGISPAQLRRLFQPFSQADDSITRRFGGTGLGLIICQQLCELMGGTIEVESEPGTGTTFRFALPFGAAQMSDGEALAARVARLRQRPVLLVDDNAASRAALGEVLRSLSFEVTAAASGEEALARIAERANNEAFELIFMDWKMPGMDGLETTRRIRELAGPAAATMILMITAHGRGDVESLARSAGVDAFLAKPVQPSMLLEAILAGLDAQPGEGETTTPTHPPREQPRIRPARVLLAEDNRINQLVARELMEAVGLSVSIADNGLEAVERVTTEPFDLLLMDIQMPQLDGYQATHAIRQQPSLQQLPIIAMTAHALADDLERCQEAGMNDHISKPIDPDTFYHTLERWLPAGEGAPPPRREVSTSNDDAALPETLPGFDLATGLRVVRGSRRLLRKLLVEFHHDHLDAAQRVNDALERGELEEASRLTHTLKGAAGSIGARELSESAARLESALNAREKNEPARQAFENALDRLMVGIEPLTHATQASLETPSPLAPAAFTARLDRLRTLLRDADPQAVDLLTEIRRQHGEPLGASLEEVAEQLDAFHFEEAEALLQRLIKSLDNDGMGGQPHE